MSFTAPAASERSGCTTTRAGSKNSLTPRPSHVGHAPTGELNENRRGSISAMVKPETGQANFAENVVRSQVSASSAKTSPSLSSSAVSRRASGRSRTPNFVSTPSRISRARDSREAVLAECASLAFRLGGGELAVGAPWDADRSVVQTLQPQIPTQMLLPAGSFGSLNGLVGGPDGFHADRGRNGRIFGRLFRRISISRSRIRRCLTYLRICSAAAAPGQDMSSRLPADRVLGPVRRGRRYRTGWPARLTVGQGRAGAKVTPRCAVRPCPSGRDRYAIDMKARPSQEKGRRYEHLAAQGP